MITLISLSNYYFEIDYFEENLKRINGSLKCKFALGERRKPKVSDRLEKCVSFHLRSLLERESKYRPCSAIWNIVIPCLTLHLSAPSSWVPEEREAIYPAKWYIEVSVNKLENFIGRPIGAFLCKFSHKESFCCHCCFILLVPIYFWYLTDEIIGKIAKQVEIEVKYIIELLSPTL